MGVIQIGDGGLQDIVVSRVFMFFLGGEGGCDLTSLLIIWLYSGWFMRGNGQTNNAAQLKWLENVGHVEGWGFAQRKGDAELIFIHP